MNTYILMSCNNFHQNYAYDRMKKILKPSIKIVAIPFASDLQWQLHGDFTQYLEQHYYPFSMFGIPRENFKIVKPTDDILYAAELIREADVILFTGGFMENLLFLLEYTAFDVIIQRLCKDKIIMGERAGALVMQKQFMEIPFVEDHYDKYKKKNGLGLVDSMNLIVHFNKYDEKHNKNIHNTKLLNHNEEVLCLSDNALVIIDEEKGTREILGDYVIS